MGLYLHAPRGVETQRLADLCNWTGYYLKFRGEYTAARPYYERALAINEKSLGPDHPDTATSLNNLGGLLRAMGDLAAARPYYERALAIREKSLGPDHPDTATSLNNLAWLNYYDGQIEEAVRQMRRVVDILERIIPNHQNTITARDSLAYMESKLKGN